MYVFSKILIFSVIKISHIGSFLHLARIDIIDKYRDLAREIRSLWKVKTKVIPAVIGVLGTVPKRLSGYLREMDISTKVE